MCTFQTGNFTRLGNEGVKTAMKSSTRSRTATFMKLILRHLVCTFQSGNFTRLGSEGVKDGHEIFNKGQNGNIHEAYSLSPCGFGSPV